MNSDNRAEGWRIFIEYYPVMLRVEAALAACEWFADGWAISIRHFSGGIALQLYKTGWHNAAGRGIHLETWISIDGVADTSVPVVIHAEREVPGRERFNRMFIERSREIMAKWSGYRISRNGTMEHCIIRVPLIRRMLVKRLTAEFTRLAEVGDIIDGILVEMSG
jgi:hypothetical protein